MIAERCTSHQLAEAGIAVQGHGGSTKTPGERIEAANAERDAPAALGSSASASASASDSGTKEPRFSAVQFADDINVEDGGSMELGSGAISHHADMVNKHEFRQADDDDGENVPLMEGQDLANQPAPDDPEVDGSSLADEPKPSKEPSEFNSAEGAEDYGEAQGEDLGVNAIEDVQKADASDAPLPPPVDSNADFAIAEAEQDPEKDRLEDTALKEGETEAKEPTGVEPPDSDVAANEEQLPAAVGTVPEEKVEEGNAEEPNAFDLLAEAQDTAADNIQGEQEEQGGATNAEQTEVNNAELEVAVKPEEGVPADLVQEEEAAAEPGESTDPNVQAEAGELASTEEEQSSAGVSSWVAVRTFRDLCGLVEAGSPLPEEGQRVGGPLWLAGILAADGPDPVISRLEWLIQQTGIELPGPTAKGVDLAMALAQSLGTGPWLQWLYSHNVCQEGATDSSGRTVESYVEDFDMVNGSLGCLNLSGPSDPEIADATAKKDATADADGS